MCIIEQIDTDKGRYYRKGKTQYKSVNTLIGRYEPKDYLKQWYVRLAKQQLPETKLKELSKLPPKEQNIKLETIGKEYGNKERQLASDRGHNNHKLVEDYLKGFNWVAFLEKHKDTNFEKLKPSEKVYLDFVKELDSTLTDSKIEEIWKDKLGVYYNFLQLCKVLDFEERVFYEFEFNDTFYGYGGTLDFRTQLKQPLFTYDGHKKISFNDSEFIIDWKNPNKRKYQKSVRQDGTVYYPLIKYGLQLAAYSKAKGVENAILYLAPKDSRISYIYYFDKNALDWYWTNFRRIVICDAHDLDFNWTKFESETGQRNHIGQRLVMS